MKIIGVIPARYKSSRFPGKPLADIFGKPMIWWVYQQAMKVSDFDSVYVATDDIRISNVCKDLNIPVIMTSDKHPTGTDRVAEVAEKTDGDLYINIQGDEPVIPPQMIQEVINIFDDPTVSFGTLKTEISDTNEINANSTVKVVTDNNDNALYFSRSVIPSNSKDYTNAKVFRHIGIYGYKRDILLQFAKMPQSELELGESIELLRAVENGLKVKIHQTKHKSVDVDYPEYIKIVEEIIKKEKI